MSESSTFVYVTYIKITPEKLWSALTDTQFLERYWFGMSAESAFETGSPWRLVFPDGRVADTGEILASEPPKRLVIKWRNEFRPELAAEGWSRCTFELEPKGAAVKLAVTHTIDVPRAKLIEAVGGGWPMVLSNLKSLLETGEIAIAARG